MDFKSNAAYKKWLAYGHASGEFAKTPGHQSVSVKGKKKKVKHEKGGDISAMGYRDDSPYRFEPYIDINTPTGFIDMSETGTPLLANGQYLPPYSGQHYMGTTKVREIPLQNGGAKERKGVRYNPDGTTSTHLMAREYVPGRGWVAFPTLFQNSKPTDSPLRLNQDWVDMSQGNWEDAYKEALKRGEVYDFGEDEKAAIEFADKGSWKKEYQYGGIAEAADNIMPRARAGFEGYTKDNSLEDYLTSLQGLENSVQAGFDKETGRWYPHKSIEGGSDTIAFGHKLQKGEDYSKGLSQEEALSLQRQDVEHAQKIAQEKLNAKYGKGTFEGFLPEEKILATDYFYNLGPSALDKFPSFFKGLTSKDKETMLKEYQRFSGSTPLKERNKWTEGVINTINYGHGGTVKNIPTWNYPSSKNDIFRDTAEIPSTMANTHQNGTSYRDNDFYKNATPTQKRYLDWKYNEPQYIDANTGQIIDPASPNVRGAHFVSGQRAWDEYVGKLPKGQFSTGFKMTRFKDPESGKMVRIPADALNEKLVLGSPDIEMNLGGNYWQTGGYTDKTGSYMGNVPIADSQMSKNDFESDGSGGMSAQQGIGIGMAAAGAISDLANSDINEPEDVIDPIQDVVATVVPFGSEAHGISQMVQSFVPEEDNALDTAVRAVFEPHTLITEDLAYTLGWTGKPENAYESSQQKAQFTTPVSYNDPTKLNDKEEQISQNGGYPVNVFQNGMGNNTSPYKVHPSNTMTPDIPVTDANNAFFRDEAKYNEAMFAPGAKLWPEGSPERAMQDARIREKIEAVKNVEGHYNTSRTNWSASTENVPNQSIIGPDGNVIHYQNGGQDNLPITDFNVSGSHEENPVGGIPLGTGSNGAVNLVREGERKTTSTDNGQPFIVSDAIILDKATAEKYHIDKKFIGKDMVTIFDKLTRKKDGRDEGDTITNNSVKLALEKFGLDTETGEVDKDASFFKIHSELTDAKNAEEAMAKKLAYESDMAQMQEKYPEQFAGMEIPEQEEFEAIQNQAFEFGGYSNVMQNGTGQAKAVSSSKKNRFEEEITIPSTNIKDNTRVQTYPSDISNMKDAISKKERWDLRKKIADDPGGHIAVPHYEADTMRLYYPQQAYTKDWPGLYGVMDNSFPSIEEALNIPGAKYHPGKYEDKDSTYFHHILKKRVPKNHNSFQPGGPMEDDISYRDRTYKVGVKDVPFSELSEAKQRFLDYKYGYSGTRNVDTGEIDYKRTSPGINYWDDTLKDRTSKERVGDYEWGYFTDPESNETWRVPKNVLGKEYPSSTSLQNGTPSYFVENFENFEDDLPVMPTRKAETFWDLDTVDRSARPINNETVDSTEDEYGPKTYTHERPLASYLEYAAPIYNLAMGLGMKEEKNDPSELYKPIKAPEYSIDEALRQANNRFYGAARSLRASNPTAYKANIANLYKAHMDHVAKLTEQKENRDASLQFAADQANQQADMRAKLTSKQWDKMSKQEKRSYLDAAATAASDIGQGIGQEEVGLTYANMMSPDFQLEKTSLFKELLKKNKGDEEKTRKEIAEKLTT